MLIDAPNFQVRILSLLYLFTGRLAPYYDGISGIVDILDKDHYGWATIYQQLLDEGRIWEFRDLCIGTVYRYERYHYLIGFLGSRHKHASFLDILFEDWSNDTFDESTSLALLDIMATLFLGWVEVHPDPYALPQHWLAYTENIASSIAETDANLLMTRPYLRWSLAKMTLSTRRLLPLLPGSHGQLSFSNVEHYLPVYAPDESEAVDWTLLARPPYVNANIKPVLKAAKHLGDLETESLCYRLLGKHSIDPSNHVKALAELQTEIQHDKHGLLNTLLFKYMLCGDKRSREHLRLEILCLGPFGGFEVVSQWTAYIVLRALSDLSRAKAQ